METESLNLKWAKANPLAKIPTKDTDDAGFDIYGIFKEDLIVVKPGDIIKVDTGIRSVFSPKYYAQVEERGSTGSIGLKRNAGVIDSSFRGIWAIFLNNTTNKTIILYDDESYVPDTIVNKKLHDMFIFYPMSKAIAQVIFIPIANGEGSHGEEVSEEEVLAEKSDRGEGMLGSSGK